MFASTCIQAYACACACLLFPQELSEATSIEVQDVLACLEKQGVLKVKGDCCFLLLPPQKAEALRLSIGRPSREVVQSALHWVPYDYYLAPLEAAPQQ